MFLLALFVKTLYFCIRFFLRCFRFNAASLAFLKLVILLRISLANRIITLALFLS